MMVVMLKRCRLSLRNGWFLSTWCIGGILAFSAVSVSWVGFQERSSLYEASRLGHQARAERASNYRVLEIGLDRPPTPLSLLNRGVGERLGSSAVIPGRYGAVGLSRRDQPVTHSAYRANVDLSWVLALVVGFTSVFFAHGVINGERRQGTLKQQLARGLPRSSLLLGEFLGAVLMVALPCALLLLGFATWAACGGPALEGAEWLRLLLFFPLVVLYGCFWISLSLVLSVVCRESDTALVLGILAWVIAAVLYPAGAGWSAARLAPPVSDPYGAAVSPVQGARENTADRNRMLARRNAHSREFRRYRALAALMPVTAFLHAGQTLATTSAADHQRFLEIVDEAERTFMAWQAEKLARHPDREFRVRPDEALNIEGLPESAYRPVSVLESLRESRLSVGALALGTVFLLLGAMRGLEGLDVR